MDPAATRRAEDQLNRLLGFFPRVEAKASTIFAVDAGMSGLMSLNMRPGDVSDWRVIIPAVLAAGLLVVSLWSVRRCVFPSLSGGGGSLIYFREVAKRTEDAYAKEFLTASEDIYTRDLVGQVHRNAEILREKFDSLEAAFVCSMIAFVPWTIFLGE